MTGASRGQSVWLLGVALAFGGCATSAPPPEVPVGPYVFVLGIAQDGGYPQAGCNRPHCEPGWTEDGRRRHVASIAIVDPASGQRWLIDATPDFPAELRMLDRQAPPRPGASSPALDGIFLTHAHIGHYTGLMHLGREVIGADRVPVYVMPRMKKFLVTNGPWSQLVSLENIELHDLEAGLAVRLDDRITIEPINVPHRDEFSETVGFVVRGPDRAIAFIPDIDKWGRWDRRLEDLLAQVDLAYLDGTFFADGELARDMSAIPHPFIAETIARLQSLPLAERRKVRFIHLNHTNPALDESSAQSKTIRDAGMAVAREGEIAPL